MAELNDAIARQRAQADEVQSRQAEKDDQYRWAHAESVTLARRFAEGLARANYQPVPLKHLEVTRSDERVRVGGMFSRSYQIKHVWSAIITTVGWGWPVLAEGWAYVRPPICDGPPYESSDYGPEAATGVMFSPDPGTFTSAVFLGAIRQSDDWWAAPFSSLLTQPEATVRSIRLRGEPCGCKACEAGIPPWRLGNDQAQLPIGPGPIDELDAYGRWQTVYPETPLIKDEAKRYDFLLGRAIKALDENLSKAGADWP